MGGKVHDQHLGIWLETQSQSIWLEHLEADMGKRNYLKSAFTSTSTVISQNNLETSGNLAVNIGNGRAQK